VMEETGAVYRVLLIRVTGAEGRLTKRFRFERGRLRLEREELFDDKGAAPTVVEFDGYQSRSGIDWPGRLSITRPGEGGSKPSRVTLQFKEVHPDAVIAPEEFRIP